MSKEIRSAVLNVDNLAHSQGYADHLNRRKGVSKSLVAAERMIDNLAVCQQQLGKLKAAEENLNLSLQLDPDFQTYTSLGNLLFRQDRWEEAAAAYTKSVTLVRSDGAYHYLAITLEKENKLKEAAEADRQALQISPDNARIREHLASVEARINSGVR